MRVRDYRLSKMFFDLQQPAAAAEFRADRAKFMGKYSLGEDVKAAIERNDAPFLAGRTNAYLLRYYFFTLGMKDAEFIRKLNGG